MSTYENYSYSQKERLANQIGKIRNKNTTQKILEIIKRHNPRIKVTHTLNGTALMYFHKLQPETYIELDQYINSIKKERTTIAEFPKPVRNTEPINQCEITSRTYGYSFSACELRLIKQLSANV